MDQEPDLIKEQMAETRVSLTDKIEKLEDTLKETVQDTLHTATNTSVFLLQWVLNQRSNAWNLHTLSIDPVETRKKDLLIYRSLEYHG